MSERLTFSRRERVSAQKMNKLAEQAGRPSSAQGGIRAGLNVTPIKIRDRRTNALEKSYLYRAMSDAVYNDDNSRWEVDVRKYKQDGMTVVGSNETKAAFGRPDFAVPIFQGDVCVEAVTQDGQRALFVVSRRGPFEIYYDSATPTPSLRCTGGTVQVLADGDQGYAQKSEPDRDLTLSASVPIVDFAVWVYVNIIFGTITVDYQFVELTESIPNEIADGGWFFKLAEIIYDTDGKPKIIQKHKGALRCSFPDTYVEESEMGVFEIMHSNILGSRGRIQFSYNNKTFVTSVPTKLVTVVTGVNFSAKTTTTEQVLVLDAAPSTESISIFERYEPEE